MRFSCTPAALRADSEGRAGRTVDVTPSASEWDIKCHTYRGKTPQMRP